MTNTSMPPASVDIFDADVRATNPVAKIASQILTIESLEQIAKDKLTK